MLFGNGGPFNFDYMMSPYLNLEQGAFNQMPKPRLRSQAVQAPQDQWWGTGFGNMIKENPMTVMQVASALLGGPTLQQGLSNAFSGGLQAQQLDEKTKTRDRQKAAMAKFLSNSNLLPEERAVIEQFPELGMKFAENQLFPGKKDMMVVPKGASIFNPSTMKFMKADADAPGGWMEDTTSVEGQAWRYLVTANRDPNFNFNDPAYAASYSIVFDKPHMITHVRPDGTLATVSERISAVPGIRQPGGAMAPPPSASSAIPPAPPPQTSAPAAPPAGLSSLPQPPAPSQTSPLTPPPTVPQASQLAGLQGGGGFGGGPVTSRLPSGGSATSTVPPQAPTGNVAIAPDGRRVEVGNPPNGYAWRRDPNGFVVMDQRGTPIPEPITPESVAASKAEENARTAALKVRDEVDFRVNNALSIIEKEPWATGWSAGASKLLPFMPSYKLNEEIEPIRSQITLKVIRDLRAASPSGAALGQISNFENLLMQRAYGSLEIPQDGKVLSTNLRRLRRLFDIITVRDQKDEGVARMISDIGKAVDNQTLDRARGYELVDQLMLQMEGAAIQEFTTPGGSQIRIGN